MLQHISKFIDTKCVWMIRHFFAFSFFPFFVNVRPGQEKAMHRKGFKMMKLHFHIFCQFRHRKKGKQKILAKLKTTNENNARLVKVRY
jgi:hypothetical protein